MRLAGMGLELPSRKVTNDDILAIIQASDHALAPKAERRYLDMTRKLLEYSGVSDRFWLADGERPVDLIRAAVDEALADARLERGQVDLVIYASVSRGFLEPAEAFALAKANGLDPDDCFDVLEACNSFSRAVEIAQLYLNAGRAENALIVVGEFCVTCTSYVRATFPPQAIGDLNWRLPSYTLGEAAAAVVLQRGGDDWGFRCRTDASLADACVVGFPWAAEYGPELVDGPEHTEVFRSFGRRMHEAALPVSLELWEQFAAESPQVHDAASLLVVHTPSRMLAKQFCEETGFPPEKFYAAYTQLGNVGSASVPTGLYLARQEGRLSRGDQVICLVGAAGMSFMLYDFVY